jgi:hypothetical protein
MQRSPDSNADKPMSAEPTTEQKETAVEKKPKRFHNGWARQLELLASEWADKAACYRWMHERTESIFASYNMRFTIPVIILSTLTGTANFGVNSLLPDQSMQKYAAAVIGGISLITGMISTVANFLRYAQMSEAHRVASISWGKFQRFVSTELALHPNERMDAMSFLKMARIELDRLIEQSPMIPMDVISAFLREFKSKPDIIRPEIAGGIEHTKIFVDRDSRLARIAADATFMIQQKRAMMRQMVLEDLDKRIATKTKEERDAQELELMSEVIKVARDTAGKTVQEKIPKNLTVSSAAPAAVISTMDRSPPKIKPNHVAETRSAFQKPISIASVAKDIAAAAAAKNPQVNSPNTITLEIIDK